MSVPYPVDQFAVLQIPDPNRPAYPPSDQAVYPPPQVQQPQPGYSLPYPQDNFPTAQPPTHPSAPAYQSPGLPYPSYPQQDCLSTFNQPQPNYNPNQQVYPNTYQQPPPQQPYPPQNSVFNSGNSIYPPSADQPGQPVYSQHPPAPGYPGSTTFDESQQQAGLNEGLLSGGKSLLKLGMTAARKANEVIGMFSEQKANGTRTSHSYYYPAEHVDDGGASSNVSSYFPDLTKHLPKQANSVKVRNLFPDQDPRFPADNRVLTDGDMVVTYFGRRRMGASELQWMRPGEICQALHLPDGPQMIVGERDRFDINQGEIGDCWFLAALANLADDDDCFNRVVPSDQNFGSGYAGIFRFRFFRFGEWVEVCVDDRLPTRRGQLIYIKAKDKNEFWSPLLEKAYAKLYGSFKSLEGGLTIEAAVDFTGGIPEMISLSDLGIPKEALFYNMLKAYTAGAFMSCSMTNSRYQRQGEQLGLQSRHAYTITKVVEVRLKGYGQGTIPLIRMRNPHGNSREWRGDWSDDNPQFIFTLTDPDTTDNKDTCSVILSLAQKVRERKTEHAIGFRVYQLRPDQNQLTIEHIGRCQPVGKTDQYINLREVSKRLQLPSGQYCIVPTTFRPGKEGEFLVRAFVERHWGSSGQATRQSVNDGKNIREPQVAHGQGRATRNIINIPIYKEGAQKEKKSKKKRDIAADFILAKLEGKCPQAGSFFARLRDFYKFPEDRNQEKDLLKAIIASIKK